MTLSCKVHDHRDAVPADDLPQFIPIANIAALEEVPATCDALGPHNKLIVAPGLLGGWSVSAAGRLSVGGKSPLTGGVKEANAGGTAGDALGRLDIKAVVVEGQPARNSWYILNIHGDAAELLPAGCSAWRSTDPCCRVQ